VLVMGLLFGQHIISLPSFGAMFLLFNGRQPLSSSTNQLKTDD